MNEVISSKESNSLHIEQRKSTLNTNQTQTITSPKRTNSFSHVQNENLVKTNQEIVSLFSKTEPSLLARAWGDLTLGGKILFGLGIVTVIPGLVYLGKKYFFPSVDLSGSNLPRSLSANQHRKVYEKRFLSRREVIYFFEDLFSKDPKILGSFKLSFLCCFRSYFCFSVVKAYKDGTLTDKKRELQEALTQELQGRGSGKDSENVFNKKVNHLKLLIAFCDREDLLSCLSEALEEEESSTSSSSEDQEGSVESKRINSVPMPLDQELSTLKNEISKKLSSINLSDCLVENPSQNDNCAFRLDMTSFERCMHLIRKDVSIFLQKINNDPANRPLKLSNKKWLPDQKQRLKQMLSQLFGEVAQMLCETTEEKIKPKQRVLIEGITYHYSFFDEIGQATFRFKTLEHEIITATETESQETPQLLEPEMAERLTLAVKNRLIMLFNEQFYDLNCHDLSAYDLDIALSSGS